LRAAEKQILGPLGCCLWLAVSAVRKSRYIWPPGGHLAHAVWYIWPGNGMVGVRGHCLWVKWLRYTPTRHLRRKNKPQAQRTDPVPGAYNKKSQVAI
jgi:hypothetical protein